MRKVCKAISLLALCAAAGCADTDLTSSPKYATVIGAEYRTKTDLYAVGVYRDITAKELGSIRVSTVWQTGPEVAFVRPIPIGRVVRVLAVSKRFVLLENGIEFIVKVDGLDLPSGASGVDVVVPLYGYMQATDGSVDASRFERMPRGPR